MTASAFSPTRLAAAVLTVGVVAATPMATDLSKPPTVTMDVAPASVVTDTLYGLGDSVGFLTSMVGVHADATISLPFEATLAGLAAAQDPAVAPNVLSYLVQRFVNPAVGDPIHAYPYDTEQAFAVLATLFPAPLGPSISEPGLINEARLAFAAAFDSVLGQLPDPFPGYDAVQAIMTNTALGGTIVAVQLTARAPLYMAWNIANYLGFLPANLEATLESAIQTPDQIPGLASNLVNGLLSPDAKVGLFGQLLDNALNPLTWLPAPIGQSAIPNTGLVNEIRTAIDGTTNAILSALPTPVQPSAAKSPPANLPSGATPAYGGEKLSEATSLMPGVPKTISPKAAPSKPKLRNAGPVKDRATRTSTGDDHRKASRPRSGKTA
jgi:hypothetical protein